jgi:hypothetical protein
MYAKTNKRAGAITSSLDWKRSWWLNHKGGGSFLKTCSQNELTLAKFLFWWLRLSLP